MINIDLSLDGLIKGNFFNFLVLTSILGLLIVKVDVPAALNNAHRKIKELIEKSEQDKILSEEELKKAKDEVANLPIEIEKIKKDAQNTISSYKKSVDCDIEKTSQKLEDNAKKIINNEVLKINNALQKELAHEAVLLAHQKTLENLKNNTQLHREFIADAIDKIEEVEI